MLPYFRLQKSRYCRSPLWSPAIATNRRFCVSSSERNKCSKAQTARYWTGPNLAALIHRIAGIPHMTVTVQHKERKGNLVAVSQIRLTHRPVDKDSEVAIANARRRLNRVNGFIGRAIVIDVNGLHAEHDLSDMCINEAKLAEPPSKLPVAAWTTRTNIQREWQYGRLDAEYWKQNERRAGVTRLYSK
jgi:hypothetical protein